jgi:hypothetical protein
MIGAKNLVQRPFPCDRTRGWFYVAFQVLPRALAAAATGSGHWAHDARQLVIGVFQSKVLAARRWPRTPATQCHRRCAADLVRPKTAELKGIVFIFFGIFVPDQLLPARRGENSIS